MKSLYLTALLTASVMVAGCDQLTGGSSNTTSANAVAPVNTVAPANTAAPAASGAPSASVSSGGGTAQQNFTVVNNTQTTVLTLHVSAVNDSNWGPDILGADVIQPGASAQVSFPRTEAQCNWDIKAVFTDGETSENRNVNLCQVATLTLTGN